MNHQNLSDAINRNNAQSEIEGGVKLSDLPIGSTLEVQTSNTLYRIAKRQDGTLTIQGHARFCPMPTPVTISGSTWGGSMLKMGFIGRGMHMEFYVAGFGTLTSSTIQEVREVPAVASPATEEQP